MDIIHGIRFKKFLEETKKEKKRIRRKLINNLKEIKKNELHQKNSKRN